MPAADTTVVVFSATPEQIAELDVGLGPCVPKQGRAKPLVSPILQDNGESPEQSAALFTVLTGQPSNHALRLVSEHGPGRLFVCDTAFRDAMTEKITAMIDMDLDEFAQERERLSLAWMAAAEWPPHYVSLVDRLGRLGRARQATLRSLALFHWFGPGVPMVTLTSGR